VALAALGVALGVGLGRGGAGDDGDGGFRGSVPPAGIRVPDFALRDYRGAVVTTDDLRGKVLAVTFLDTQCTEACPVIARRIADAWPLLRSDDRSRTAAYAITVDPEEDTPRAVRGFLRRHKAESALGYLVGPPRALRTVWDSFQIVPSVESGEDDIHSAPVRIYNSDGVWVSTLHPGVDLTPENLAHDLSQALDR
jgi:protein SCO1